MMKNIYIVIAAVAILFTTSCSKEFLDQQSPDKLTTGNFWRDQTDAEAGLASAYSQLESSGNYWSGIQEGRQIVKQYRSDLVYPGADALNYASWTSIYNFTYTGGNPNIDQLWKYNYMGINYANQVIKNVGLMEDSKIDATVRKNIIAEAKFLRAYYHFELLCYFEDIIIRDDVITDENLEKAVSTRSETYDFIISDFKSAATDAISEHDNINTGRADKFTVQAYLGKTYLYRAAEENATANYTEAKAAFASIVANTKFDLVDNYIGMFDMTYTNSKESLFEFQMSNTTDSGAAYKFVLYFFYGVGEFGGWDEIVGVDKVLDLMKSEGKIATDGKYDSRLYWNCYFNDPYYNDNNNVYGDTYDNWFEDNNDKIVFRKYLPKDVAIFDQWEAAQNVPLMRFADVLLMQAEVLNELGETATALPLINRVRTRANMPATTASTQEQVREQIKHERVMELTLEGCRFFDLKRWGDLEAAMSEAGRSSFNISEHSYFPIPDSEVQANSKITR